MGAPHGLPLHDPSWDEVTLMRWLWRERILPRLTPSGECLVWNRKSNTRGYGRINIGGKHSNGVRQFLANRVSLECHLGRSLQPGMKALHTCDNPLCCNPDHLREGTQTENIADCVAKDRHAFGTRNGHAKITEEDAAVIRESYAAGGIRMIDLADEFGLSVPSIHQVVHRKTWRHVA